MKIKLILIIALIVLFIGLTLPKTNDCLTISSPDNNSAIEFCDELDLPHFINENETCRVYGLEKQIIELCNMEVLE